MAHSYLLACAMAGAHITIASPVGYGPRPDVVDDARALVATTGGSVDVTTNPVEAVTGVDVVVTDTWVSMGKEEEKAARVATFAEYQVDDQMMALATPDAIFMHCLPADRGFEVSASVIDGPHSVVWDESENRLHAQKALLAWLLERA
jgi:ornithine carbamoyltransferase